MKPSSPALRVVEERLPGAAPVSQHSYFEPVSIAAALPAGEVVVVEPASRPERGRRQTARVSLAGPWQRLALTSEADAGPPAGLDWGSRVHVPDCYGQEPTLSAHFGPVYYGRRVDEVPGSPRTRLVFGAVDYLTDAWLGGRHLGHHEGYFAPFAFDVTGALSAGDILVVRVQDPFEDLDPNRLFFQHAKRVIKGTLKYHDSRPGGLPGRSTPGWDPRVAQSLTSAGITGEPRLEGTGPVRLDAVFVTPKDAQAGLVHVAWIVSNLGDRQVSVVLSGTVSREGAGDQALPSLSFALPPGSFRIDAEVTLVDPAPWWPRSHIDLGGPRLYHLGVECLVDDELSDTRSVRFGLRTARVTGDPKHLEVNGRKLFVQAVNYIPRQHFADATQADYDRDMRLCAEAHVNSLGVHGHLQCPPCYDAADEAGMLVFQDFPLQWHYDAGSATNPTFIDTAERQIAEMAYTFYNHPSIVYWACHNEPTALFIPGAPEDAEHDFDNQVLDRALEARLRLVESHRHVHRASGIGDDYHLYDGSLNGGSVYGVRDRKSWFISEYGFWTIGPREALHQGGTVPWPPSDADLAGWLSRLSFGPWTFLFSGLPERYPSFEGWQRATEAYGDFLVKYQTEWMRIHRGAPFNAYRLHFFVDWWGYTGGGLLDKDRHPKAMYHAFQAASRPLLVATSLPGTVVAPGAPLEFDVYAVNESREDQPVEVSYRLSRHDESLVIGCDPEAADRYSTFTRPDPNTMVALPYDAPAVRPARAGHAGESGVLRGVATAEASTLLGRIRTQAPDRPFEALRLDLSWGGETNYFHVLAAEEGWFCGPGAFAIEAGQVRRLS